MDWLYQKQLGFGCMRLPLRNPDDPTSFDYPAIEALFDAFLAAGGTYFDTAYVYHGGRGEEAVRRALVERHPRETFQLTTKLPLRAFQDAAGMEKLFREQLERCGVEWFDGYLLHNMGRNVYQKCVDTDAFGFLRRKKAEGRILATGMSFHDTPELLEEILERYGDCLDFVQLQINYADWEQPAVQSRRCLEIARRYGKPVAVMEPCKGGALINLPAEAAALLRELEPGDSPARWAMRFAASQDGVGLVLSGMNAMEQLTDNLGAFAPFRPLEPAERAAVERAGQLVNADTAISCTACGYCLQGCPRRIPIPQYFALYNSARRAAAGFASQQVYYNNLSLAQGVGLASDCIACRQCERACPQHLAIVDGLKTVYEVLEKDNPFRPAGA